MNYFKIIHAKLVFLKNNYFKEQTFKFNFIDFKKLKLFYVEFKRNKFHCNIN